MKSSCSPWPRLVLWLGVLAAAGRLQGQAPILHVYRPAESAEILANPGMGWETFRYARREDRHLPPWIPSTVLYARWGWGVLEPHPGQLNTALIDSFRRKARLSGQKLAFRVMCCSPYLGQPYQPDWLQAVGGRELTVDRNGVSPLTIPDLDDPVVLTRHLDFIRRLGERYDGDPDLDHLDLGSVGWWGEWHMSGSHTARMPTLEHRLAVVNAYLAAFKKTPLIMLLNGEACTTYATRHGAGWRADSLGDLGAFSSTWNHMRNGYPLWFKATQVQDVWRNAPVAFEPPNGVDEFVRKGWPLRWIFNYALACHASYFNGKSAALPDDDHLRQELSRFLLRLGYRLVLREIKYPARVAAGSILPLEMQWQNTGSAPCYRPYRLAYRLASDTGDVKVVVCSQTVGRWLPGSVPMFTPEFFREPPDLPPGPVNVVNDRLQLPGRMPPERYTLSIGLVGLDDEKPQVQLGIAGRGADGWYAVGQLAVVRP